MICLSLMSDFWPSPQNRTLMNKIEHKWIMYYELHKQKRIGLKPSQIASFLGIDKRTVKKYLAMSEQEYLDSQELLSNRGRKLEEYENFIKDRLENCIDASAAQVHDWLKECHPDFLNVSQKTVYNFVQHIREKHQLLKIFAAREFCKVQELPYGQQAQVDFGEYNMTDLDGGRKKVYFFAMVLSRSRYKFVYFSDHPFTTQVAIQAHEEAFEFINGYPHELVYDQDKLLLVKENKGDLILTDAFRNYHLSRSFHLHFCRKSDPQSKGKVENVIKYIKYNFLRGRTYFSIHTLNDQAIEWLERTANVKVHSSTHLIPALEWMIEKTHLKPLREAFLPKQDKSPLRARKDNTVNFKGNFYSLPMGTYKGSDTLIYLIPENDDLIIRNSEQQEIARHKISQLKGKLVFNNNHYRNQSIALDELIKQIADKFSDTIKATAYLENLRKQKPRYARDQVEAIEVAFNKYSKDQCDQALDYCTENNIQKANDFEPVIIALIEQKPSAPIVIKDINPMLKINTRIVPQTSNISDYNQILK